MELFIKQKVEYWRYNIFSFIHIFRSIFTTPILGVPIGVIAYLFLMADDFDWVNLGEYYDIKEN